MARLALIVLTLLAAAASGDAQQPPTRTRNVVLIVADGVRWQEVFRGRRCDATCPGLHHGTIEHRAPPGVVPSSDVGPTEFADGLGVAEQVMKRSAGVTGDHLA